MFWHVRTLLAYTYSTFPAVRIGKQNQPKLVRQATFGGQKWFFGSVWVAKFGPARTTVGRGGGAFFGNQKWSGGIIFGRQNQSGGPLLGRTNFRVTGQGEQMDERMER